MRRLAAGLVGLLVCAGLAAVAPSAVALDNGLALTPPMGFNSWNAVGCNVDEQVIKQAADFLASSGLKNDGYDYVNIDDCWLAPSRDAQGRLVPDPVKFPDGIKGTADYVHSKGLKLGIYEDAGTATCQGYPGSLGHEQIDAQTFADWGVDYLKYDNCNNNGLTTRDQFIARYKAMGDALAATGRKIVYSICQWGGQNAWEWAGELGNLWRTTGDIKDNWSRLEQVIDANAPLAQYAHPGAWNDPDMLEIGNGGMTDIEYRTQFSLWAEMAAPLLIGTDLTHASAQTMAILGNRDVIAVDQDSLGLQGRVIAQGDGTMVFDKPLANGDRAVALYNANDVSTVVSTTAAAVGLPAAPAYTLTDLWSRDTAESAGVISAAVPAHGTVLYRVRLDDRWASYPSATELSISSPTTYAYSSADVSLAAGTTARFSSTLADNGRLPLIDVRVNGSAAEGWTLHPVSTSTTPLVPAGTSMTTDWALSAPASAPPGTYPVAIRATYRGDQISTAAVVRVVPTPPRGTAALSGLSWVAATTGAGAVGVNTSSDGNPMTIRGQGYATGLGVRSPSSIVYYLGGNCSTLVTDVGIDDEVAGKGLVSFHVFADDAEAADSGQVKGTSPIQTLHADLTGATWLRLYVDPEGTNSGANVYDHADWAAPTLTCEAG